MYKYSVRFADRSTPAFFNALSEIADKFDFPGFDPADHADVPASEIDVELHDEDGNVIAWIVPA